MNYLILELHTFKISPYVELNEHQLINLWWWTFL